VVVVPDERLNAIVVHASRNDRETIEELLRILDSADIPESLASNKPKMIPIKNTDAERIEDILRDLYRGQLTSGGGRRPIPVPSGVSPQVAAAIQQANATSGGPLLTLGVDEASNSLIVLAPITLTTEIEQLVAELDTAAIGDSSRSLRLIPLQKTNSKRVRAALDMLMEDAQRNNRRPRRGNR
jgi:type II secretory pathway component GspD/PulD (secretin)